MISQNLVGLGLSLALAAGSLVACSEQTSPASVTDLQERIDPGPWDPAVTGSYELSFVSGGQEVFSLPACTPGACFELELQATVQSLGGAAAAGGMVTYQYCSLKGLPPNDIDRADEAPKEACETGEARWESLGSVKVTDVGGTPQISPFNFGVVLIPRTVGFRFRYSSQGSSVASGVSGAENFTWTSP